MSTSPPWLDRLTGIGATAHEISAIQASYLAADQAVRDALDQLIAGIAVGDLLAMLNAWRGAGTPFPDGFPTGGLPFGTGVALLTGDISDDAFAVAAGTGARLAVGPDLLTPTAVKTSTYTVAPGELVPVDASAGTVPITLPAGPPDRTRIAVKIIAQAATPNAVTISRSGGDVFNKTGGSTTLTLTPLFQGALLQYQSSTGIWYVTALESPLNMASGAARLGTDGTVGGPGGSPLTSGIITSSATAGGAESADRNRGPSTIAAPVLRDFIALKDKGYDAKGGAKPFSTGAVVSSSTLTDTTNNPFSAGSVGMTVTLPGTGTSGRNFSTTIATFTDAGHVTLTAAPPNAGGATGAYQLGWDDTAHGQTALDNIGVGVLYLGQTNFMMTSWNPKDGVTINGYGASIWQIAGQGNAVFYDNTTDNVTVHDGFKCLGVNFHGTGLVVATNAQLDAIWLVQWKNVTIRDCKIDGFADGAINVGGGFNVWIEDNHVTNCTIANNRNAIRLGQGSTNTTLTVGNWFVTGNRVGGTIATAALSINNQAGTQGMVGRIVVTGNNFTTTGAFASVFFELNTTGGGANESTEDKIIFAHNDVINTGTTATSDCMVWVDDSSNGEIPFNDPVKFRYITIASNYFEANSNSAAGSTDGALVLDISHANVHHNTVVENGTRGQCLYVAQSPLATGTIGNLFDANKMYATNTAGTNHVVRIRAATNWKLSGGFIFCSSTVTGSAISVENVCVNWRITGVDIFTPAQNGINVPNGMTDGQITHTKIYNPNASAGAGSTTSHGIYATGTHGGTLNLIEHNTIWDDRGTPLMKNGIFRGGTGTIPLVGPNHVTGTTNGAYSWQPLSPSIDGLQAPMRVSSIDTTIGTHERGVVMTTAGTTATQATGFTAMQATVEYLVKNGSAGTVIYSNGANKIDNITGGINATSENITVAAQCNRYTPAPNLLDVYKT